MGNASQINRSRNSVRVERRSDLNEADLGEVYCTSSCLPLHFYSHLPPLVFPCTSIHIYLLLSSLALLFASPPFYYLLLSSLALLFASPPFYYLLLSSLALLFTSPPFYTILPSHAHIISTSFSRLYSRLLPLSLPLQFFCFLSVQQRLLNTL